MLTKFFKSVYFNVTLAVLAAFFAVFQEVAIGTVMPFLNIFLLSAFAGVSFSWMGEAIKILFFEGFGYSWKNVIYGGVFGILVALLSSIIML
jgi:hypothetical protein